MLKSAPRASCPRTPRYSACRTLTRFRDRRRPPIGWRAREWLQKASSCELKRAAGSTSPRSLRSAGHVRHRIVMGHRTARWRHALLAGVAGALLLAIASSVAPAAAHAAGRGGANAQASVTALNAPRTVLDGV